MKCALQKSRKLFWILVALGAQFLISGVQATIIVPTAHDGSTVWTGDNPLALNAAQIGAIVGEPGLGLFYDAQFGQAQFVTTGGTSSQVVFTAVQSGIAGHDVTVRMANPGVADSPLSVLVTGRAITVSLATDASGAITTTAADVVSAVNASSASTLVVASTGGSGNGVVQTLGTTLLTPVIAETGPFASVYQTDFANSTSFPQDAIVTYGSGTAIDADALFLYVRDTGHAPAFYIYDLLPPAFGWDGFESLELQGFWPNDGAIEQLSIVGVASSPTPVPESSSLALLALGIGVLTWYRGRARLRA